MVIFRRPRPEKRARKPRKPIRRGNRPRRQRKSSPAALKRKLWGLLRAYVADAWGDRCFTCGAGPLEGINRHTGHFINAGKSLAVRYAPDNLRTQCGRCNVWQRGNIAEFSLRLLDQIGEEKLRTLLRRSRVIVSLKASDVREMIEALERGGADYELYWEQTFGPRLDALGKV